MVIYQSDDGVKLDVRLENKTVWLNQDQIASLFNKSKSTIVEHISNIFKEGELDEKVVVRKFRITTQHGAMAGKTQSKEVKFYNLDVIISVGYRVKSIQGTRFRQWATERLNESIVKGFTMDDERLKNLGGGNYWKELLDHTRDCHEKINKKMFSCSAPIPHSSSPRSSNTIKFVGRWLCIVSGKQDYKKVLCFRGFTPEA